MKSLGMVFNQVKKYMQEHQMVHSQDIALLNVIFLDFLGLHTAKLKTFFLR